MAYLEQKLEQLIVEALSDITDDRVYGYIVPTEQLRDRTCVLVKMGQRKRRSTNNPIVDISCKITIMADKKDGKDTDLLAAMTDPVINCLEDWEGNIDIPCDLLTTDTFRVDGFTGEEGEEPSFDSANQLWSSVLNYTFSGVILTPVDTEI